VSNEDVETLEEQLAEARAELEALRERAADREARASHLEAQLAETRAELSRSAEEARGRDEALAQANERAETLEGRVRAAAERYRALALERSPELPEELVARIGGAGGPGARGRARALCAGPLGAQRGGEDPPRAGRTIALGRDARPLALLRTHRSLAAIGR
jgi:hypothetical protein